MTGFQSVPSNSSSLHDHWLALRRLCTLPPFETPQIEAEFWSDRDERLYFFRRWMLLAGIFAFAVFCVVDVLIVEERLPQVLAIRFGATGIALGLWVFFCTDRTPAMREAIIGIMGLVTIGGNLAIITVAGPPIADLLPFAVSMIMAFGVGLVAPRLRTAVWTGSIAYLLYWTVIPFSNSSFASIATNAHFLSLSVFAALVGTFVREKLEREQAFAKRRLLVLNERAVEMSLAKDRLLASVSHELRTPINAISGFSEVMQKQLFGPVEPDRYREYVDDINFSARLLRTGIDDLLEVSRIGMQKVAWQDETVQLPRIIEGSVAICGSDARIQGVRLLLGHVGTDLTVRVDPQRLTQTLVNVIANAVKFSSHGQEVRVATRRTAEDGIAIVVTDTGCGIDPNDLEHIREPFRQAHADHYSSQKGGLGLGLSIANGFVEMMEGRLDIESVEGEGTVVSIVLPPHRLGKTSPPSKANRRTTLEQAS